ncbi:MAG: citrate synthase [Candidatus Ancillula sp.]|jgi:citrate synthase|nr:citrate synthase [Candidatus Ancillula sp.]
MRLAKERASLNIEGREYDLPLVKASQGPDGILISSMRNDEFVTLDPGFLTTAQCESKITYIDGDKSILRYRGYPIEQLCESATFLEVAFLIIFGNLPKEDVLRDFIANILQRTIVGEDFQTFLGSFPRDAHPMSMLASSINALESFLPQTVDVNDEMQFRDAAMHIMAKVRTIVSFLLRRRRNEPLLYPNGKNGYVDDFMRLCFGRPYEEYVPDQVLITALDKLLILQADHEQNCSTSVVRVTGSSNASLYASIASGVNALSGPLHGGANEAAFKQLLEIQKQKNDYGMSVKAFVEGAKVNSKRIMGLGHRVYKSYDPRAAIAKQQLLAIHKKGIGDAALLEIALELESIVSTDEYFLERKLYPNIDFWTALCYHCLGFDSEMFTALFALARIPGWIAHWREMHQDPLSKIGRPRQVYSGYTLREYPKKARFSFKKG